MAAVTPPRSFAERPKSPLTPSKPAAANDNASVLGKWENGVFRFASPEAREKWKRRAYEGGVNEDTWHLGKEIDPESAGLMTAGFGGASSGIYRGPDGIYRQMNPKTIESQEARDHRNKYLTGKTIDALAKVNSMPGAEEWVANGRAALGAANEDAAVAAAATQAPPRNDSSPEDKKPPSAKPPAQTDKGAGQMMAGRFGAMKPALESADKQGADDIGRLAVNTLLGNYGDELRAGVSAAGSWWDGKSFGDAYDSNLQTEREETSAAQERQGLTGTGVELLTSLIPIVGDASGAFADFKDWQEHGDEWGWTDYGLVALGLVPELPSRKQLKSGKKLVDGLADKAKSAWKGEGEGLLGSVDDARKVGIDEAPLDSAAKKAGQATFDPKSYFPKDENEILTKKEALNLPGEKVGLVWVVEPETHIPHAAAYEREGDGYLWSKKHNMPAKPSLRWDNPDGDDLVKFDHLDPTPDATYLVLVDSKADRPPVFPGADKTTSADLRRQVNAVRQNNLVTSGPKMKIRYELPDGPRSKAMKDLIEKEGYTDDAIVKMREASKDAQDKFKKLRKTE